MGDLISRQAVLNALKEHRSLFCDNTPETFSKLSYAEKSRVDELDTAIATIINLPSVENKGEWIPVSERLPEEIITNGYGVCNVLVTRKYGGITRTQQAVFSNGRFLREENYTKDNTVTAWRPLPEPYQKGE